MLFHLVSKFGVKGPLGAFSQVLDVCIWFWRKVGSLPLCDRHKSPPTILITRNKGHPFGSFIWHGSCICSQVWSLKVYPHICLSNFPVKLTELAVYSIADDHIWSHLTACLPFQVCLYQPALVFCSDYIFWEFSFFATISSPLLCVDDPWKHSVSQTEWELLSSSYHRAEAAGPLDCFTHEGTSMNWPNLLAKNGQLSSISEDQLNSKWERQDQNSGLQPPIPTVLFCTSFFHEIPLKLRWHLSDFLIEATTRAQWRNWYNSVKCHLHQSHVGESLGPKAKLLG